MDKITVVINNLNSFIEHKTIVLAQNNAILNSIPESDIWSRVAINAAIVLVEADIRELNVILGNTKACLPQGVK